MAYILFKTNTLFEFTWIAVDEEVIALINEFQHGIFDEGEHNLLQGAIDKRNIDNQYVFIDLAFNSTGLLGVISSLLVELCKFGRNY